MSVFWSTMVLVFALMSHMIGCAGRSLEPEPIVLDQVACARCGMLISRLDHAAQAVYTDAETRMYDDIGCLATDEAARTGQYRFYVHTSDGRWADVTAARFVRGSGARTPMGYDIVARAAVGAAGRPEAPALTWAELLEALEHGR